MTRIADLGEACDKAIKTLSKLIEGEMVDEHVGQVQLNASTIAIHAYFDYQQQGMND